MKKKVKKLILTKETLKGLEGRRLAEVAGAAPSHIDITRCVTDCECPPWW